MRAITTEDGRLEIFGTPSEIAEYERSRISYAEKPVTKPIPSVMPQAKWRENLRNWITELSGGQKFDREDARNISGIRDKRVGFFLSQLMSEGLIGGDHTVGNYYRIRNVG